MIRETIITTCNANGEGHVAPMGVHVDGDELVLAPFKPSRTLDNLLHERCAVINYTDDVRIFSGCLSARRNWPLKPATHIEGKRLASALAHTEVEITSVHDDEVRPRLSCKVVHQETHAPFQGFNRAQAAVIELAILVSRLHLLPWEKTQREMEYLQIAIDKTAGEEEIIAWRWLMARVESFRRKQDIDEQTARERTQP